MEIFTLIFQSNLCFQWESEENSQPRTRTTYLIVQNCIFMLVYTYQVYDFHVVFSCTVEVERLVEIKRERECRVEEKVGGKGSTEDNELQTSQKEDPPVSPVSLLSSPMSPVSSISPVSSPVSPLSSTGDQMQTAIPSSPPRKQSWYLHYAWHRRNLLVRDDVLVISEQS